MSVHPELCVFYLHCWRSIGNQQAAIPLSGHSWTGGKTPPSPLGHDPQSQPLESTIWPARIGLPALAGGTRGGLSTRRKKAAAAALPLSCCPPCPPCLCKAAAAFRGMVYECSRHAASPMVSRIGRPPRKALGPLVLCLQADVPSPFRQLGIVLV